MSRMGALLALLVAFAITAGAVPAAHADHTGWPQTLRFGMIITESGTMERWQGVMSYLEKRLGVNVKGTYFCARAAMPLLKERRGCLVNVTSVAGLQGHGSSMAYAASKAAVNCLTKSLARAFGPTVRVNAVAPGPVLTRWLAEHLSPVLGQPIVVENRTGAGGNLGTAAAARSAPDGYTFVVVHIGTMTLNPHLYTKPGYDPLTDIAPITRLGVGPQVLAVHKDVPARSVQELIALARARPDELTFVSPGVGTPGHLASSLLMYLTGIKAAHVPYKGGGQWCG